MSIHPHPHLHALVADGLFQRGGWFHVLPETGIANKWMPVDQYKG